MKPQTRILGYSVQGRDKILRVPFVTGLERTERQARRTLSQMLASTEYTEEEKKTYKVVRISEIIEEL